MVRLALAAAVSLLIVWPVVAQEAAIAEVRERWERCTALVTEAPDDWLGWRRDFQNGYGDSFQLWDRTWEEGGAAVLRQVFLIDGIAIETDTHCFREDGSLAFIYSEMVSPNMAVGFEGPSIAREGRLYFDPSGERIRVLQQITQDGEKVADGDNADYQLARGCGGLDVHMTLAAAYAHAESELGDIEGNRPAYERQIMDWCEASN